MTPMELWNVIGYTGLAIIALLYPDVFPDRTWELIVVGLSIGTVFENLRLFQRMHNGAKDFVEGFVKG